MKLVIASRYTGQLSIDAQLAPDRAIRATLLPGQTIDVSNIATPDELNRDEGISRLVRSGLITVTQVVEANDISQASSLRGPVPDGDGVVRFYVGGPTGSDSAAGTFFKPMRTVQEGVTRVLDWLKARQPYDVDLVIHNEPGVAQVYSEYVDVRMPVAPQRRVRMTGKRDNMVKVFTGTLTAATAFLLTDSGAAFGAANQQARRIIKIWNDADYFGTVQWKTISWHTNTALVPVEPFMLPPSAGWKYEVLRPGVRIVGDATQASARGYSPTMTVSLPWGGGGFPSGQGQGPCFIMSWLQIEQFGLGTGNILVIDGGFTQLAGIVLEGDTFEALTLLRGSVQLGQVAGSLYYDPLWDLQPNDFGTLYGAGIGVLSTQAGGMVGMRIGQAAKADGSFVFNGAGADFPMFVQAGGYGTIAGGATHSGRTIVGEGSILDLYGGFFGADIPFQVRNCTGIGGLEARANSALFVAACNFEGIAGSALAASKASAYVEITGPLSKSGAGVSQYCVNVQNGGQCRKATAATVFAGTVGEVLCDTTADTFANLPIVGTNTGSRAWQS